VAQFFTDQFEDYVPGVGGRWSILGATPSIPWTFTRDRAVQVQTTSNGQFTSLTHTSMASVADGEIVARITKTANGATNNYWQGLLARYQDSLNYVRVTVNTGNPLMRIQEVVAGSPSGSNFVLPDYFAQCYQWPFWIRLRLMGASARLWCWLDGEDWASTPWKSSLTLGTLLSAGTWGIGPIQDGNPHVLAEFSRVGFATNGDTAPMRHPTQRTPLGERIGKRTLAFTGKQQPHATPRKSYLLGTTSPTPATVAPLAPALRGRRSDASIIAESSFAAVPDGNSLINISPCKLNSRLPTSKPSCAVDTRGILPAVRSISIDLSACRWDGQNIYPTSDGEGTGEVSGLFGFQFLEAAERCYVIGSYGSMTYYNDLYVSMNGYVEGGSNYNQSGVVSIVTSSNGSNFAHVKGTGFKTGEQIFGAFNRSAAGSSLELWINGTLVEFRYPASARDLYEPGAMNAAICGLSSTNRGMVAPFYYFVSIPRLLTKDELREYTVRPPEFVYRRTPRIYVGV